MTTAVYNYDLRFSSDGIEHIDLIDKFKGIAKKWCFQLEKGEKTGYMHYQCRISLIKKLRKRELINLFDPKPGYCEPTLTASKNDFYVCKELTRVNGPWSDQDKIRKPLHTPKHLKNITLRPFQRAIFENQHYSHRSINYIYDPDGNTGKSTTFLYCRIKDTAIYVPPVNDSLQLMQFIFSILDKYDEGKEPQTYIIDLPRSMTKDGLYGMYSAIEQLKNGYLYEMRFHGKERIIDIPNIWLFGNEPPDMTRLSQDRWNIWQIDQHYELKKWCPKRDDIGDNIVRELVIKKRVRLI